MLEDGILDDLAINTRCSICFEDFSTPKILSCGHTFCLDCLQNYATKNDLEGRLVRLPCPECRQECLVPGSDVSNLPDNFQSKN